ncbi:hypothetical protein [Billgrantia montanilacus]|uniref:Uncharacterized protein n=1 Tax=Billgrantia montanilacus TaxID=2282305 RepID=A0A368TUL8_9GAMM|nr:hypothetical protein [Halomonas montanilacus]RCV88445.1 hypothetical protein DU505_14270 [Halomonas montanilacus]
MKKPLCGMLCAAIRVITDQQGVCHMSHEKHVRWASAGRLTALASAMALSLGTLSLAGCGNDDDLPPVEQEPPATEQQGSPMQDTTADPGIDQTGTAAGDGAEDPAGSMEQMPEEDEDAFPEAEQEPVPDGAQDTMAPDDEEASFTDDDTDDEIER